MIDLSPELAPTYRPAESTVVFVFDEGELGGTLGTLLHILQLLHVGLLLPNLRVQGPQDVSTNP